MTDIRSPDWSLALLRQNPFPDTPPLRSEEAVWAGFPELEAQFEALFVEALCTSATQVVLNRGDWGSGKTHAAIYFGTRDRLPPVEGRQVKDVHILYIRTPKEPAQADVILYRDIVEAIQFSRLRRTIGGIIAEYDQQTALEKLQETAGSEALGRALWLLGLEKSRSGQLRLLGEDEASAEWHRLLEAYFFSQYTKSDLKHLGLSRGIDNAQDRFRVLGTLLQCLVGLAPTEHLEQHARVILWMDEMEDLFYYTTRQHRPFTQGLRDLIDALPGYLTLFMNFTLAEPESLEDIRIVLGGALMDRITHHVYFREPDETGAFEYVSDLLQQFRTERPEDRGLPITYPFTEDALRALIAGLSLRTPRDLNQACSETISKALQQGVITAPGEGMITRALVLDLEKERIRLDFG